MPRPTPAILLLLFGLSPAASLAATVTPAQRCEADVELASAQYAKCRLTAEAKYSETLDADKRATALARCSDKLQQSFAKAVVRYGASCTGVPVSEFDGYLTRCSNDAAAAAAGAALPDYVGDLLSCNADLTTCNGDLTTRTGDLAICSTDLATCEGDLAACEALPPARLLKTGQTTSYGAGSDGDLQVGVARNFVDNGDGTITDTSTGLMWEKKSDDGSIHDKDMGFTWCADVNNDLVCDNGTSAMDGSLATGFFATLNAGGGFAGHADWRLPNLTELESIRNMNYFSPSVSPMFNTNCGEHSIGNPGCTVTTCSCSPLAIFWSSTTFVGASGPKHAWGVDLNLGYVGLYLKMGPNPVRAVRGGS